MKKYNNFKLKTIFFVGIGGISMSGLCKISMYLGAKVMGSDIASNAEIDVLKGMGVKIYTTHDEKNITKSVNLVVYSGAIKSTNPELQKAKKLGIKVMERAEFLGEIASMYDNVIAVSGTHGKTTTTAMLGYIFTVSGLKPTIHLGGESVNLDGNTIISGNKYFICEACEYRESFRFLKPNTLVVTNIESDHLDYFKTHKRYERAFRKIMSKSKCVIKDKSVSLKHKNSIIVGKNVVASNLQKIGYGYNFDVLTNNYNAGQFRLNMIGRHNVTNALFAISTALKYGIDIEIIKTALDHFRGVKRRYEYIGKINNTPVIIDYAHHPTELKSSIAGIRTEYKNPLIIFQPHTYSRTISLKNEFKDVLCSVKDLVLFKTYPARETEIIGGRAWDLYIALDNPTHKYFDNVNDLYVYVKNSIDSGGFDCVLILGAGDLAINFNKYLFTIN